MGNRQWGYVARPPRYGMTGDRSLEVVIRRTTGGTPECIKAELLNLSRDGFQVQASDPLATDEAIVLELQEPKSGLDFTLPATVCWQKPQGDNAWVYGCRSTRQLDWETLGELFLHEILAKDL